MKKNILSILLPIMVLQVNASTIGVNTVGVKLGGVDHTINVSTSSSTSMEFTGLGYEIGANFNLYKLSDEKIYGLDVPLKLTVAPNLEDDIASIDVTRLNGSLRPYIAVGKGYLFADIGLSYISAETSGALVSEDFSETSFAFGVGGELTLAKSFRVTPSLNWASYGGETHDECTLLTIPLSYSLSEKFDVSLAYERASFSTKTIPGRSVEPETDAFLLGFDMKF